MIHRDTDIVSAFRSTLNDRIGSDRYELWFADAHISIDEKSVLIAAKSAFAAEQMRKTFLHDAREAGQQALGSPAQISIQVQTSPVSDEKNSDASTGEEEASNCPQAGDDTPTSSRREKLAQDDARPRTLFPLKTANTNGRKFASLSSFVQGECNRLATCSVDLILKELGGISPFFLHGPSGCGKTHLLEGVWSKVRSIYPRKRAVYLSAEQFTTYFLQALKGGGLPSFRRKYRGVDLLIIDDVQFFTGKQATIVELLHTIDANLREGGQLILAADRSPSELRSLGQEMLARLSCGLACEMKPLDVDTRRELLLRMAATRKLDVHEAVINDVAETAPGDGRQLSGLLNRMWVSSRAFERPVCGTMAREIVRELFPTGRSIVRLNDIE